jgi:hypothetical protein
MIKKSVISLLTLIALSARLESSKAVDDSTNKALNLETSIEEEKSDPQLQEQNFKTIDYADIQQEDYLADKFKLINPRDQNTNIKKISIKNEFFESIKIVLDPMHDNLREDLIKKELYLNAYENKEDIFVTRGIEYNVKVYNLYNEYLGDIFRPNIKSKNKLAISPFFLIKEITTKREKPILVNQSAREQNNDNEGLEIAKQDLKRTVDVNKLALGSSKDNEEDNFKPIIKSKNFQSELITEKQEEETEIFRTSKEQISDIYYAENNKTRNIKVANISDKTIRLNIEDRNGNAIGGGWTIKNDIYVPQYLNFKSVPVEIKSDAKLIIQNSDQNTILKKLAKELNIDEKGNYVWFID